VAHDILSFKLRSVIAVFVISFCVFIPTSSHTMTDCGPSTPISFTQSGVIWLIGVL
jgi:hypothetical protein